MFRDLALLPAHKKEKKNKEEIALSGWSSEEEDEPIAKFDILKKNTENSSQSYGAAVNGSLSKRTPGKPKMLTRRSLQISKRNQHNESVQREQTSSRETRDTPHKLYAKYARDNVRGPLNIEEEGARY